MLSPLNQMILIGVAAVIGLLALIRILTRKRSGNKPILSRMKRKAAQLVPTPNEASDVDGETRAAQQSSAPRPQQPAAAYANAAPQNASRTDPFPAIEFEDTPLADRSDLAFGRLTLLLASLLPESDERKRQIKRSLQNAGYFEPHAWHNLAAARYLAIVLPILAGLALLLIVPPSAEPWVIGSLVALPMLGWSLPTLYVRSRAAERLAEIERAMPDVLDMLNMCVSQGMTVSAALRRICGDMQEVSPALAKELQIVVDQTRVGSLEQALVNFGRRVDLPEVHSFTSLLIQTERMGTSMSEALTEYSDNMRETLRQQADQQANTASFKLLFPTVLCLMPAVFMILLGPAVIEMSDFFQGGGADILDTSMESAQDALQ
ncbi:MAG: type II secretion system F family protein [Planctomycetota bacterium]|nr:MAG: type II secretion system F family protein [Planctomycetota bacterium]REK20950.1 MAG: type II secretion system F family protein [Planctomycetota bacterium]REK37268.1 MAG: type II secretion system F family protein [Planctomycetota bacterium]